MRTMWLKAVDAKFGPILSRWLPAPRRVDFHRQKIAKILVVRPGGIGDAVMLVPTLRALHEHFPKAKIHILAESRNAGVFSLCGCVDSVRCYDHLPDLFRLLAGRYDLIIDSEQWHHFSAVLVRLLRSKFTVGFDTNCRRRLFSTRIGYDQDQYELDSFLNLLTPLGIVQADADAPWLEIPQKVREAADEYIVGLKNDFVAIFPGASIRERRWGSAKFAELVGELSAEGVAVVILGGSIDQEVAETICRKGGLNLTGQTSLAETAAILQSATLLVTGDSGLLHLAAGLGTSTVSLFGPGRQLKWAPRGRNHLILNQNLDCSPCTTFGYTPECENHGACLDVISVSDVVDAVHKVLKQCK